MTTLSSTQWLAACSVNDLVAQSGVAVLLQGKQIALFYLPENLAVYAIDNYCPFSDANVISANSIYGGQAGVYVDGNSNVITSDTDIIGDADDNGTGAGVNILAGTSGNEITAVGGNIARHVYDV